MNCQHSIFLIIREINESNVCFELVFQGSGATPLDTIALKDIVLITAVVSSGFLIAISLLVVASRLRKDRKAAYHIY